MKKTMMLCVVISLGLLLAGCGAQKNALDSGIALYKSGDCASAAPFLDETVATPDEILDLALAYYIKGKCAEKSGDAAAAYENLYAAKVVGAYTVAHDTHINLNTYARTEYVEVIIPKALKQLAQELGEEKVKSITEKMNATLNARYMERFANYGK